ncbi:unnamed protein product [Diabrotica balteata]|uniref:Reverse transcriptase domain-containing protein n=1 Tax=Diabrotica balteata TaxID=107213 RepID=A0A9N9SQS6_DIABA|nr:unnamed protein product [Diabrotica balteata]
MFNSHNAHYWCDNNPRVKRVSHYQHLFKVNVWAATLDLEDLTLNERISLFFMHDGAPPHFDRRCRNWLSNHFPNRWIGRCAESPIHWPPRSCDFNPLDYAVWSYIKEKVYATDVNSRQEFQERIQHLNLLHIYRYAVVGVSDLRDEKKFIPIKEKTLHEKYDTLYAVLDYDIAIVKVDDTPTELLKLIENDNIKVVVRLFNSIYNTGVIPADWLKSIFIAIPKKHNARKCSEYRLISLMSHTLKIYLRILHNKIRRKCEKDLEDTQFGFRTYYKKAVTKEKMYLHLFKKALERQPYGININGELFNVIRYADNRVILSDNIEGLQILLDRIHEVGEEMDIKINSNKTKFLVFSRDPHPDAKLQLNGV